MNKKLTKRKTKTIWLVVWLIIIVVGGVLFVGAVAGWFGGGDFVLDAEYYSEEPGLRDLSASEYESLLAAKKSFIVFVDQNGCSTADTLREFVTKYAEDHNMIIYRMMFSAVKESSLHEKVKYYPSVVLVFKGKVWKYLRADEVADAAVYNDYDAFLRWMQ